MEAATIPQRATIPITDLVRAQTAGRPVTMPVQGALYARLDNITGVPAPAGAGGYSLRRLQAIDALIARMRPDATVEAASAQADEMTRLEREEIRLEQIARDIAREMDAPQQRLGEMTGLVLDVVV